MIRMACVLLLLGAASFAKDREWISGTVSSIEQIPARVTRNSASTDYTIKTKDVTYTLEDAAFTYYTGALKEIFAVGDTVRKSGIDRL